VGLRFGDPSVCAGCHGQLVGGDGVDVYRGISKFIFAVRYGIEQAGTCFLFSPI
jgi:hypothetical protein